MYYPETIGCANVTSMPTPRDPKKPLRKIYLSMYEDGTVTARVVAPQFGVDRKGTGRTIKTAVTNAMKKIPKAKGSNG